MRKAQKGRAASTHHRAAGEACIIPAREDSEGFIKWLSCGTGEASIFYLILSQIRLDRKLARAQQSHTCRLKRRINVRSDEQMV